MDWKLEHKTVWKQLSDKISLTDIHAKWVPIPVVDFWWKHWGEVCDSYRSVIWAYLMKEFNVEGWERYNEIIDKYEQVIITVCYDGEWREYKMIGDIWWTYKKI